MQRADPRIARAGALAGDASTVLVAAATALVALLMVIGAGSPASGAAGRAATTAPASAVRSATAVAAATTAPIASATPVSVVSPTPSPAPAVAVSPYTSAGHRYAGIEMRSGTVMRAPMAGTIEVRLYQFIGNEVRVGSNVTSVPFYPYVTVISADRRLTFRPGALGIDTEVLVQDGQRIAAGDPLFRASGPGRSSWATFYDPTIPFQVVVSLSLIPSGADADPLIEYPAN
jgi:biotin carboxyl carrier protein